MENILVVDDEVEIWKICQRAIENEGYMVYTASNGDEALKLMECVVFDIALVDLHMPVLDGQDLIRKLREHYPQTEIIVITAETTVESALESLQQGVFDYIIKPFDLTELLTAIKRAVEYFHLRRKESLFRETTYLYQLAQEIGRNSSAEVLLRFILERAAATLNADAGSILMLAPDAAALRLASFFGLNLPDRESELRMGERIAGWVAQNRQPLLIKDLYALPQFRDMPLREEIASSMVVPLVKRNVLLGVICLNRLVNVTNCQFTQRDIESLQIFATHASLIIALQHQNYCRIFN